MYPYLNAIKCYPTVSVPTTALGTDLLTAAQIGDLGVRARSLTINSSADIALVDGGSDGTYANSPWKIPANAVATFPYNGGPVRAISSSGTATVCVGVGLSA